LTVLEETSAQEKIVKKRIKGGRGTGDEIRLHGEAGAPVEQEKRTSSVEKRTN